MRQSFVKISKINGLAMDRASTILCGWKCWRRVALDMGWDVPDEKSPLPSVVYLAVGYSMCHLYTPRWLATLEVSEGRREALIKYSIALSWASGAPAQLILSSPPSLAL